MWYEIFRFECRYRLKRPETYLFFTFILAFSVIGVDFVFQGVDIGLVKLNAPLVIAKTMGAITLFFMILTSMIMGMPMIRDEHFKISSLIYTNPIKKSDLLIGRFVGSFLVLVLIFSGVPLGMIVGECLPWRTEMNPFNASHYFQPFLMLVLPTLFFGATLFFVTGTMSRSLLVVYTQGLILFVWFILTKAIPNEYLQAVLDPFSLTTTTLMTKDWTVFEKNNLSLPMSGVLLINKIFWICAAIVILIYGCFKFDFSVVRDSRKGSKSKIDMNVNNQIVDLDLPQILAQYDWKAQMIQFFSLSQFYAKILIKTVSFWAIVMCAVIIIVINSINLGTVFGVDSYPTSYFIVEELQELSMYFFVIILLFYSGELYWKAENNNMNLMFDATPISAFVNLVSQVTGLIAVYVVLILALIISGIVFQVSKGYDQIDLSIFLSGFFIEILPFLMLYTIASFLIHALVNHKFIGIIVTLIFFIAMNILEALGVGLVLINFGGSGLNAYSEMNGYGHFLTPYLWIKSYWLLFGVLLLVLGAFVSKRGVDSSLKYRVSWSKITASTTGKVFYSFILFGFIVTGVYVNYQSYILNEVWSIEDQQNYRANYEQTLKQFEYKTQPNIVESNLNLELYPEERSYLLTGEYVLKNETDHSIDQIHIQKLIESNVSLDNVQFSLPFTIDDQYNAFAHMIYHLKRPLISGDSLTMTFRQKLKPKGFDLGDSAGSVLQNGTFIRNNEFPTIGYNGVYELRDAKVRKFMGLAARPEKAEIDDIHELKLARSGSDSHGTHIQIIIGTSIDQLAVTSGTLINTWENKGRRYFEYHTDGSIINFYSILSGRFDVFRDTWYPTSGIHNGVELEIYHHPTHVYNLDRMMNGMKASLDYYSAHFSPYQYRQLKIVEFPRYEDFAQSFPNTIPFSESIGFILDIDDATEVDMTFFITAHEVAHQWWGMQVEAANVKGRNFVLETLAQYSALMVFKHKFSQEKVDQLLTYQQEQYDLGQKKAKLEEVPLYLVGKEAYIYYNKGAVVMYELQEMIGEENVNCALQAFIHDWNSENGLLKKQTNRYATSEDLIAYILDFTSEKHKDEVENLFKAL